MEVETARQKAMNRPWKDRTSVIAHRLLHGRNADRIVVLDEGASPSRGRMKSCSRNNGLYHRLCVLGRLLLHERRGRRASVSLRRRWIKHPLFGRRRPGKLPLLRPRRDALFPVDSCLSVRPDCQDGCRRSKFRFRSRPDPLGGTSASCGERREHHAGRDEQDAFRRDALSYVSGGGRDARYHQQGVRGTNRRSCGNNCGGNIRAASETLSIRDLVGDEPLLLASPPGGFRCGLKDRLRDVDVLSERNVRLIVADDAFQHRRMGATRTSCLSTCPFGNGWIAPAGILRESPSVLAGTSVLSSPSRTRWSPAPGRLVGNFPLRPEGTAVLLRISCSHGGVGTGWKDAAGDDWFGTRVLGHRQSSFRRSLEAGGVDILKEHRFKDHYRYRLEDMALEASLEECGASCMVCTEKDVYNLPQGGAPRYSGSVHLTVLDEEARFRMSAGSPSPDGGRVQVRRGLDGRAIARKLRSVSVPRRFRRSPSSEGASTT